MLVTKYEVNLNILIVVYGNASNVDAQLPTEVTLTY